ncbi:MAG: hypothetical protein AMXMBFR81_08220 [Chthonomonas sp.]
MPEKISDQHPIRRMFGEMVHRAFHDRLELRGDEDVERYVSNLLVEFLHDDQIYAIRNAYGKRVTDLGEMLLEGDVRYNAPSFEREREVHKHVGDFLLFWAGLFPESVPKSAVTLNGEPLLPPIAQGRTSYGIVSEFRHEPFGRESSFYDKMSRRFEAYVVGLRYVRQEIGVF